ncbi:MAG: nitroreductase family protein [Peptoniphilaceae bacterium]|nr:nitroreductase family protein [Peptoniphilaceae bacterium]MDY6018620.1 nitroreductase family protein [Anaerococcus sp.]
MLTTNFLKTRTSTRNYLDKNVNEDDLKKVIEIINEESEKLGKDKLAFHVNTDGANVYKALSGLAGYSGVMIKAPMYIALNTLNNDAKTVVIGAYGMEEIITKLNEIGLGTCWIDAVDVNSTVKESVFNFTDGKVNHLLAVGYPEDTRLKEHRYDDRLGVTDFVYLEDFDHKVTVEQLEQYGLDDLFHYARFAPSAYNAQPWRFVISDGEIKLYIKDYKGPVNLIDAGIIMYYIDELTRVYSKGSKWEIEPDLDGEKYAYIAKKSL